MNIKENNFFMVKNSVIDNNEIFDNAREMLLYIVLTRYCNNDEKGYPSLNFLAKKCFCSKSTLIKTIKELQKKGLIDIKKRYDEATRQFSSNLYTVNEIMERKEEIYAQKLKKLKDMIIKATNSNEIDLVFQPHYYPMDKIDLIIQKIQDSDYLSGRKSIRPTLTIFIRPYKIREIMAGVYDDFKSNKKRSDNYATSNTNNFYAPEGNDMIESLLNIKV